LILVKSNNDTYLLNIYDIESGGAARFHSKIIINDPTFIGNIQTVENTQNDMIPSGNNLYTIAKSGTQSKIIYYTDVLPLSKAKGDQLLFTSPLIN
jgi:hypothetical protein